MKNELPILLISRASKGQIPQYIWPSSVSVKTI